MIQLTSVTKVQGIQDGWKMARENDGDGQRKAETLTQVKWMSVSRLIGKTDRMHGFNVSKYPLFLIIFLFTVLCQILWGMTDFALISSRATRCHALNRTGPLCLGWQGWERWTTHAQPWQEGRSTSTAPEPQSDVCIDQLHGRHPPFGCWRDALSGGPDMDSGNWKSKHMWKKKRAKTSQK